MRDKTYRYFDLRNMAWQVLLDCNIKELPTDLLKIAIHYNIETIKTKLGKDIRGQTILDNNGNIGILYDKKLPEPEARFTIAHELGHILLSHNDFNGSIEKEANSFAARILMPACVLKECKATTPTAIAKLCNTSIQAATFRAERMQKLLAQDMFYTNPLEKQVYMQFRYFIVKTNIERDWNDYCRDKK